MTERRPTSQEKRKAEEARARESNRNMIAARWSAMGLQFVISVVIGYFAGHWLDGKFHTAPWLMIGGILLGLAAAIYDMVILTQKSVRLFDDDKPSDAASSEASSPDNESHDES